MIIKATEKKIDIPFIHLASRTNPFSLKLIALKPLVNANSAVMNNTAAYKFPFIIKKSAMILAAAINKPASKFLFNSITPKKKSVHHATDF